MINKDQNLFVPTCLWCADIARVHIRKCCFDIRAISEEDYLGSPILHLYMVFKVFWRLGCIGVCECVVVCVRERVYAYVWCLQISSFPLIPR